MGIAERREREREEVRRKILDAAREQFATEGYENVTMRGIAEAIEYSPTTIYNHFEDKNALVNSLCEEDFSRLLATLQARELPADPVERIRQLGLAYASFGINHPNHYRFMFMTPGKLEDGHELSPPGKQAFELLRAAIDDGVRAGRFVPGDPVVMGQVLWASLHGIVSLLVTYSPEEFPGAPASPDIVRQVVENGLRGLLAVPGEG